MKNRLRTFCLLLILSVGIGGVLSGCGSSGPARSPGDVPANFPNHSADQIRSFIVNPTDTIQKFSAQARVSVQSPSEDRSFNADVRQQRADSLLMRFSLFGIEGGRMLLTSDSVFIYDSRKQQLRVGSLSEAQSFLPVPVESNRVFENMLGFLAPNASTDWTVTADSSNYYLTSPNERRRLTVDPTRWRVIRYAKTSKDGTLLEERLFTNFESVEGVQIPHRIIFRRPSEGLMALIKYRSVDLNPSNLSFDLGVSEKVPRTPIR